LFELGGGGEALSGEEDRLLNGLVACTTAEMSAKGFVDLFRRGVGGALEEGVGGQEKTWSAVTALNSACFDKGQLEGMEAFPTYFVVVLIVVVFFVVLSSHSFDGKDRGAIGFHGKDQATTHRQPIEDNSAGATLSIATALFCTGQVEVFS